MISRRGFASLTAQGLRPVDISGYEVDGSARYAALFEASSVPARDARHGVPGGDYQAVADANITSGLRPLRVSGFTVGGATYFASIWVTDDGTPWAARHGLDNAGFQAEFDSQTAQGLRLVDISGYESNGADFYTATFDASPTAFWISHHNMSNDAYQAAFNENGAAGYMLTHIAGYGVGGQARYAAIWAADAGPTGGTVGRAAVDEFATDALAAAGVPGVSVAIAKDGRLVYAKGYGAADGSTGEAMTVQHRLRIASISKPITATVIVQLAENGVLTLGYSNFGYCLLGRIIETATGQGYESYVQSTLLAQCGITDMQVAGDSLAERAADEVVYDGTNSTIGDPYGIPVRRMDSHGGWIATATDLFRFMVRMDQLADPADVVRSDSLTAMTTGSPANPQYGLGWTMNGSNWFHTGRLGGTESIVVRHDTGISYAVIANGNGVDPDTLGFNMAYVVDDWGAGTPL